MGSVVVGGVDADVGVGTGGVVTGGSEVRFSGSWIWCINTENCYNHQVSKIHFHGKGIRTAS